MRAAGTGVFWCAAIVFAALVGYWSGSVGWQISVIVVSGLIAVLWCLAVLSIRTRRLTLRLTVALGLIVLGFVVWEPAPFDLLVITTIVGAFVTGQFRWSHTRFSRAYVVLLVWMVGSQIASFMISGSLSRSAFYAAVTVLLLIVSLTFFMISASSFDGARLVVRFFFLGAVLSTGIVLFVDRMGIAVFGRPVLIEGRLYGFFKDPNVLSPYLVTAFVFGIAQYGLRGRRTFFSSSLLMAQMSLLGIGIFLAFSRGGWVNLAVTLCVYWALRSIEDRSQILKTLAVAAVFLIPALYAIDQVNVPENSMLQERLSPQAYDDDRFATQQAGMEGFLEAPLWGHGPGTADVLLERSTHNGYVRILFENGIFGFVPFAVLFVGASFIASFSSLRAVSRPQRRLSAAVAASLAGVAINSLVIDSVHWRHLWVLIGLGWATSAWLSKVDSRDDSTR